MSAPGPTPRASPLFSSGVYSLGFPFILGQRGKLETDRARLVATADALGEGEIGDFRLSIRCQKDIRGLEIAMDQAALMRGMNRARENCHQLCRIALGKKIPEELL